MNDYLKIADVFNDKFDASMLKVNPECVNENYDDGVTPHDYIAHAVKSHDELVSEVELLRKRVSDSRGDVVKLKKEIERLSSVNAEIIDAIDSAVSSEDMQPVRAMRKKHIID